METPFTVICHMHCPSCACGQITCLCICVVFLFTGKNLNWRVFWVYPIDKLGDQMIALPSESVIGLHCCNSEEHLKAISILPWIVAMVI